MASVFAVLGRPGSEAGLFARLLRARLRAPLEVISVPAAAATEIAHRTHLGQRLQQHQNLCGDCGDAWLPSALVAPLVQSRLQHAASQPHPVVLAGFPRTLDQMRMLQHAGLGTPRVVHLAMSRQQAVQRVGERRVCATCGEPMYRLPPPVDASGAAAAHGRLYAHFVESDCDKPVPQSADLDAKEELAQRLDAFDRHTLPLIERLRAGGAVQDVPITVAAPSGEGEAAANFLSADDIWTAIQESCGLEAWKDSEAKK